jgi:3-hydroxyacyl-CoA dehydrogenase
MSYNNRFKNVSVLGAAGKMGSGILYLNTLYISQLKLSDQENDTTYVINAIDQSHKQLEGLMSFIKGLLLKWAEKNTIRLRKFYAGREDLVENGEIIQAYIADAISLIKPTTRIEAAYDSTLVFEAVSENIDVKTMLFRKINENNDNDPWFLTNTSSIPIRELNSGASLGGNIIGCHFYNPPAVQKLIEVIETENGNKELTGLVHEFGKALGKIIVPANDIAGFIGNGFFMRDLLFGLKKLDDLRTEFSFPEAVLAVDTVTRDFMLRPMGIFQLTDYVGIDVCSFILNVMNTYLDEDLYSGLLIELLNSDVKGGQFSNGSQKPGLFTYEKGRITSVYDFDKKEYVDVNEVLPKVKEYLGALPEELSWKALSRDKNKLVAVEGFFKKMKETENNGCRLAEEYMHKMKEIGEKLVADGVTDSVDNVNTVMITGFHHLYGPVNDYV